MEVDWELLVQRITDGACVPFLGAAANVSDAAIGYAGTPLGEDVSQRLAKKLKTAPRDPSNLARVSLHYEVTKDRPALDKWLCDVIGELDHVPSPLLTALATLPFKLIVTTNYDRLLERALDAAGTAYRVLVQPPGGFEPNSKVIDEIAGVRRDDRVQDSRQLRRWRAGGASRRLD